MAKRYTFDVDGKKITVEADSQPTPADIQNLLEQRNLTKAFMQGGLPGVHALAAANGRPEDIPAILGTAVNTATQLPSILGTGKDLASGKIDLPFMGGPGAEQFARGANQLTDIMQQLPFINKFAPKSVVPGLAPAINPFPQPTHPSAELLGNSIGIAAGTLAGELPNLKSPFPYKALPTTTPMASSPATTGFSSVAPPLPQGMANYQRIPTLESIKADLDAAVKSGKYDKATAALDTAIEDFKNLESRHADRLAETAHQTAIDLQKSPAFQRAANAKYDAWDRHLDFVSKRIDGTDVQLPHADVQSFIRKVGSDYGLLDPSGQPLRPAADAKETAFLKLAKEYGILNDTEAVKDVNAVKNATMKELVDGIPDASLRSLAKKDPKVAQMILEQYGGKAGQGASAEGTVNLRDLLERIKFRKGGLSNVPRNSDRLESLLKSGLSRYISDNAESLGYDPQRLEAIKKISKEYIPFAQFKEDWYNMVKPGQSKNVPTEVYAKLVRAIKGQLTPQDKSFIDDIRTYVPELGQFDFRFNRELDAFNAVKREAAGLGVVKRIASSPEFKKMQDASELMDNALKQAGWMGRFMSRNMMWRLLQLVRSR